MPGRLLAVSDLHIGYPENRAYADSLAPEHPDDWLIVAGDVGESFADVGFVLASLANRFARVIWTPGNHELWTLPGDPVALRGAARYDALVTVCRRFGVLTPEDEFPRWPGPDGPVTVAPLFTLYDYSFASGPGRTAAHGRAPGTTLTRDRRRSPPRGGPGSPPWTRDGCTPTRTRRSPRGARTGWRRRSGGSPRSPGPSCSSATGRCRPRRSRRCGTRSSRRGAGPRSPTAGTPASGVLACVYGHLHIPRSTRHDGVRFEEVSVGYPREWQRRGGAPPPPRVILGQ